MLLSAGAPAVWKRSALPTWDAGPAPDGTVASIQTRRGGRAERTASRRAPRRGPDGALPWVWCQGGSVAICGRADGYTPALFCLIRLSVLFTNGFPSEIPDDPGTLGRLIRLIRLIFWEKTGEYLD